MNTLAAGPGPKPAGPTRPTPTGPRRARYQPPWGKPRPKPRPGPPPPKGALTP